MTPDNFCYWLQGYFELTDASTLTSDQAACVHRHSDLVIAHCIHHKQPVPAIVTAIRTLLRVMDGESAPKLVAEIKHGLADEFLHVIDPKAGPADVQAELNVVHHGSGRIDYSKPVMRC